MAYRNGNYAAFYVDEPFKESNLGANATADFVYYNLLRAWKGGDSSFPFIDSHEKNYNVRDGSDWGENAEAENPGATAQLQESGSFSEFHNP